MIIIVGLGNPGTKFDRTRHNIGFLALDFFAAKNRFPDFVLQKKYDSLVSEDNDIVLAKPQTFMNESGVAVRKLLKNKEAQIVIVHDDIDLEIGKLKIVKDRGSAGHKGIDSIIQSIGNDNVVRFRIGIATNDKLAKEVVLEKFSPEEQQILDGVLQKVSEALDCFIKEGLEKTMNKYN